MNVSKGDLAYIVPNGERDDAVGRVVEVLEYRGIVKYTNHGCQPTWVCKFKEDIVAFAGEIPCILADMMLVPDFCLRRIAGPGLKVYVGTVETTTEKA